MNELELPPHIIKTSDGLYVSTRTNRYIPADKIQMICDKFFGREIVIKEDKPKNITKKITSELPELQHVYGLELNSEPSEYGILSELNIKDEEFDSIKVPILQFTMAGEFIAEFDSIKNAVKQFGGKDSDKSKLHGSLYEKKSNHGVVFGFRWKRKESLITVKKENTKPKSMNKKIEDVRNILFEQLERLKNAGPHEIKQETERSQAMIQVSHTIIESAKAETDFLRVVGSMQDAQGTGFISKQIEQ